MPQILASGTWTTISDVVSQEDGQIMSFTIDTPDHGPVTLEANLPWQEWKTYLDFVAKATGGAVGVLGLGLVSGPVGVLLGAGAGVLAFFKSHNQNGPGYIHRESDTHYFDCIYNIGDTSSYRAA